MTRFEQLLLDGELDVGEVMAAAEVDRSTVWRWQNGRSRPRVSQGRALVLAFQRSHGLSFDCLYGDLDRDPKRGLQ